MNQERIFKVLVAPLISEKASFAADKRRQVVFRVAIDATKAEIRESVERLWNVKVRSVQTSVVKGKSKRFGRFSGVRSDWKKAYVALADGHDIDFMSAE